MSPSPARPPSSPANAGPTAVPGSAPAARLGIDLGGTKIEGVVLAADGREVARRRIGAPRGDYGATLAAITGLIAALEADAATAGVASVAAAIGVGVPGSLSPASGRMQGANSTWLNGQPLERDLAAALGRPVRLANDANCFALSEARDGAAAGARSVFGVILGTGCGGGVVIGGRLVDGPRGIGGEWGHTPLPWAEAAEHPGARCWCSRRGCMETWVSGPALAADHARTNGLSAGDAPAAEAIAAAALAGDGAAEATLARHAARLARGLAVIVNILDPEVIVLGGGLSGLPHLYRALPGLMAPYIFAEVPNVDIRRPRWGDASGVRGAARLWDGNDARECDYPK